MSSTEKFIPGSDAEAEDIFKFPFLEDEQTVDYITNHGRIMFIVRGPPGTGKRTLTDLIIRQYPNSKRCSADEYFSSTFNSPVRNRESLRKSHEYCYKMVRQECLKTSHPVIVSNTHMKKMEMQMYLNYAAEFGYTVIMAITMDKFKVSPEILAKSNTKGLSEAYLSRRLKQWENVFPVLTGWFLCLNDSQFVLNQLQCALETVLEDGKFCRVFNVSDKDCLLQSYRAKEVLFCVAAYSINTPHELKDYYQSSEVKASYGKSFSILIKGFIITTSDIMAIVQINDDLKHLIFEPPCARSLFTTENDMDDFVSSFRSLSVQNSYNFKTILLSNAFPNESKTAIFKDSKLNPLNIESCSVIHIAQKEEKPFSVGKTMCLFKNVFGEGTDSSGNLLMDELSKSDVAYKTYRLTNDSWLVKPPKDIFIKTIFTGLYI